MNKFKLFNYNAPGRLRGCAAPGAIEFKILNRNFVMLFCSAFCSAMKLGRGKGLW